MLLGDLIKEYRTDNKLSLRVFAERCGLSHTYISALEKNIDPRTGKPIAPTLDTVKYISKGMNISIEEILKILDDEQEFKMNEEAPKYNDYKFYMCPVYGQISAGIPNWAEECIEGRLPIDPNLMNIIDPEECYFLRVNGESMNKLIRNGAYALIRKQDYAEDGDIVVAIVNGDNEATLKRFKRFNEQFVSFEPMSSDESFKPINVDLKSTNVIIIGKYIGKFEMK